MKKLAISVAVTVALGLTGCGDSLDDIKNDVEQGGGAAPSSRVVFDPSASRVSVPNDLLFLGTTDGTLTLDSGANPDYTSPQTALGALDGWSTQNPFTVELQFFQGATLNADSASLPGAVRLYEITTGQGSATAASGSCEARTRGHACEVVTELTFGQDFISAGSNNNVAVIPLRPFKPATTYLLVLSSVLTDSNGNTVKPSTTYELLQQDFDSKPLATPDQRNLQQLINSFEDAAEAEGVNKDSIIYTAAITTQSVGAVLTTLKQLMASGSPYTPSELSVNVIAPLSAIPETPFEGNAAFDDVILYGGNFDISYYLGAATAENPQAPLSTRWTAACDSGAIIAALPDSMKPETPVSANDGFCQTASGGALRDLGVDAARHLTKFNTIPVINSREDVKVQMTVPNDAAPANGWPVVILQHGITSQKEDMLAVTGALSAQGFATVAIDHPLHGDRGFGAITASGANGNPTVYMNLSNLLVTRDNLRQSIADMLALRLALNSIQGVDLDMENVYVLGHSLGAIASTAMVSLANTATGSAQLDALYQVKAATLGMPGGAIANFLLASPSFSPLIKSSLILGAGGEIATSYTAFADANQGCGGAATPPFAACYEPFISYLQQNGQQTVVTQLNATFTQFAFAAQTVVDSGDPNNYAAALVAAGTPVHVLEVVGDGANNLPDQVIPNGYANPLAALAAGAMPLAGTEPLARLLQTTAIGPASPGLVPLAGNGVARFNAGTHSSLLDPLNNSALATAEMQTQAVSFFLQQGAAVNVLYPSVLVPAN